MFPAGMNLAQQLGLVKRIAVVATPHAVEAVLRLELLAIGSYVGHVFIDHDVQAVKCPKKAMRPTEREIEFLHIDSLSGGRKLPERQ